VTESSIAVATKLPQEGERWFKNKDVNEKVWRVILRNPGMDISIFKQGIPISALKDKWTNLMLIIRKFITCEGRYGSMYMYHIRLLMNFLENESINLPYFLLNSLRKMSTTVQKNIDDVEPHLYHHGLIKILVENHLKEREDTWEKFLVRNFFQDPPEVLEGSSAKKSRRKITTLTIQDTPTSVTKENSEEELPSETLTEIRKQVKQKGKRKIEDIYQTPKPCSEEEQVLYERLVYLKEQSTKAKKRGKGKHIIEKRDISSEGLRRSSILEGKLKKTQIKGAQFIDLGGETPDQSPENTPPNQSP